MIHLTERWEAFFPVEKDLIVLIFHSIGIIFFGNDTTAAAKHILDISVPWE